MSSPAGTTPGPILIVEDEAIIAADLEDRLQRMGYVTLGPAASGAEALALAREHQPALALTDIRLHGEMDGVMLAGILQKEMDIPVIFLTAHADQATLDRAQVTESFGYLLKPFDERILQITIGMALYKHRMELERKQLADNLAAALEEVKTLSGLLLMCSVCRKIEDKGVGWVPIERYIAQRTEASVSHTYCPDCLRKEFPDIAEKVLAAVKKSSTS